MLYCQTPLGLLRSVVNLSCDAISNKAIVDSRLRPRSVLLLVCQFEYTPQCKSTLLPIESLLRRLFVTVMCKCDVIHRTGNRQHIATPRDCVGAAAIGKKHEELGEDQTLLADRQSNTHKQTDRHDHRNIPLPYRGRASRCCTTN